jgi:hypothetical protein
MRTRYFPRLETAALSRNEVSTGIRRVNFAPYTCKKDASSASRDLARAVTTIEEC